MTAVDALTAAVPSSQHQQAFTVQSFCTAYGVGKTTVFAEIAAGRLQARKLGGKTLIGAEEARRWFDNLPAVRKERR